MVLTGCTARPSAEVQLTEESRRRIFPTAAVQGYQIPQHANTHSETTRHKHPLNLELNKTVGRGAAGTAAWGCRWRTVVPVRGSRCLGRDTRVRLITRTRVDQNALTSRYILSFVQPWGGTGMWRSQENNVINSSLIDTGRCWLQGIVDCFVIKLGLVLWKRRCQILRCFDHLREAGQSRLRWRFHLLVFPSPEGGAVGPPSSFNTELKRCNMSCKHEVAFLCLAARKDMNWSH